MRGCQTTQRRNNLVYASSEGVASWYGYLVLTWTCGRKMAARDLLCWTCARIKCAESAEFDMRSSTLSQPKWDSQAGWVAAPHRVDAHFLRPLSTLNL